MYNMLETIFILTFKFYLKTTEDSMGIIDSIDRSDSIVTLVTTFIHFIHINFITQGAICIFQTWAKSMAALQTPL